ncbi:GNAT family N-acetyltransferase [Micromonospora sp. WMMD1082]|uniref:GNAT family N-acetyltransferase n=1 Tax=Micromonospora sp. WMMD1082 TaxID=3016104 RepID=UPI002416F5D8|nr:GNAT family N-acetyltransferase [Micromonospora sp. WMMD1082]MDG4798807.1 GNAT family N-acetyltransferase [Micromonospora sp. WMMD1082]
MALIERVRDLWVGLAGVATSFPPAGVRVVTAAGSRLAPPGWAGIVVLGDAGIATVPHPGVARYLHGSLSGRPASEAVDAGRWRDRPEIQGVLGPAALAYLDERNFERVPDSSGTPEVLPPGHPDLGRLLGRVGADEAGESGIEEATSPVFVVRDRSEVVAAAGYREWPGSVAHLCVLTDSRCRGRGLAGTVASAAVADALRQALLPQWRARLEPSRRLARRLGFRELGTQLSVQIAPVEATDGEVLPRW